MFARTLITGASRGIGLEFTRRLLERGGEVIATIRDPDRAGGLKDLHSSKLTLIRLDVADPSSISALTTEIRGPIDLVINNAGISSESKTLALLDVAELQKNFMVNAIAPMLVTRAVLANLRAGQRKTVIQISSILGSIAGNTGGSSYGYRASKAALNQFNRSLAASLGPEGFTCVSMHPGWVRTDMGGPRADLSVEDSVAHMLRTVEALSPAQNGAFLNYDGTPLPW